MPHIVVKLASGRTEEQKRTLADELSKTVTKVLNCGDDVVSVAVEDVDQRDWTEKVYKPDILGNQHRIYKKPGYDPLK